MGLSISKIMMESDYSKLTKSQKDLLNQLYLNDYSIKVQGFMSISTYLIDANEKIIKSLRRDTVNRLYAVGAIGICTSLGKQDIWLLSDRCRSILNYRYKRR